jgi:hypothetical protein
LQGNHLITSRSIGRPSFLYTNYYTNAVLFEEEHRHEPMAE